MAKRRRWKRKLLHRVLGWVGIGMVLAGIGRIVLREAAATAPSQGGPSGLVSGSGG